MKEPSVNVLPQLHGELIEDRGIVPADLKGALLQVFERAGVFFYQNLNPRNPQAFISTS